MRKLKNFFVKTQSVKNGEKGLLTYLKYLENQNHPNHQKTQKIIQINGKMDSFFLKTINQVKKRQLKTFKNGKGGRPPSSFCQSFVFSFPTSFSKIEKSDYEKILKNIYKDLSEITKIPVKTLIENSFINIHENENKHINIVINKFLNEEKTVDFSKKNILNILKTSFNTAIFEVLGVSVDNYNINYPTRKNNIKNPYFYKKKEEYKKEIKEEIKEEIKLEEKLIKRYFNYLKRYKDRINQKDITKKEKNKNYMNNTIIKIKNLKIIENLKKETKKINENYLFPC